MYPCAGTALASEEVYRTYQVHKGRKEMCVCGMLNFGKDMLNSALIVVKPRCPLMLRHMLDCGVTLSEACLALLAWTEGPVLWPSWPVGRLH